MAELSEEQLRVRGYLQSQAAKLSPVEVMVKVRADSEQLRAAAVAAMAVDSTRRPADGEWSVNEVLNHVRDSCRGVNARMLAAALSGQQPGGMRDAIEPTDDVKPPLAWFEDVAAEREAAFEMLLPLSGEEHLDIRWEHPFFGALNWREWLLFLRLHDLDHAGQIRGIVESLEAPAQVRWE